MSPDAWEQDCLDSIKNGLADSDPALVARLAMFTRLASGEAMPVRDQLQAASRRMVRSPARRAGRMHPRLGLPGTMLLVWLVTTAALIAAALTSSRVGPISTARGPGGRCVPARPPPPRRPSPYPDDPACGARPAGSILPRLWLPKAWQAPDAGSREPGSVRRWSSWTGPVSRSSIRFAGLG
jgi:hypothetical protein